MKSIRVKNLHCISDTKVIPLKGINLLVGANSSGKSSILRLFPLLKQGLEVKKRGPCGTEKMSTLEHLKTHVKKVKIIFNWNFV